MHRFYADDREIRDGQAWLEPEDARHAARVLRMKAGERLELFSDGGRWEAEFLSVTPEEAVCRVIAPLQTTEPRLKITLYQGLPKGDKMDLIVQKATELGACRVVPVAMSRSVVQLKANEGEKKRERWQRIAREAAKQSGRCLLMPVEAPISMKELLRRLPEHEAALIPWEDAAGYSLTAFHREKPEVLDVAVVIGPEGGMSAEEVDAMLEAGGRAVTLGPRILRTETAGLAAITALLCLWGEMEA